MLPRRPGEGRRSAQHNKLLLAIAFILLPWVQLTDAQQQRLANPDSRSIIRPDAAQVQHEQAKRVVSTDSTIRNFAATPIDAVVGRARETVARNDPTSNKSPKRSASRNNHQKRQILHEDNRRNFHILEKDESALATLAPADAVRAPHPPRHLRSTSIPATGLTSPQLARSLEDWEVEDFVLLATVDGDLYASDRRTGKQRWHLEVDQPMVETTHYRGNNSVLDDDYSPVDHYIWAVEPNHDGGLFIWIPDSDAGLVRTQFTMKRLVEELAPYADKEPPVVYTGDKKTTMVTLDAATGRVLKWFGSGGSHVNEADSCSQPNTFMDKDDECSTVGTITLGRTEYTVGIQRQDGRPIATLKYSEWGPNNFDSDLYQQYHTSLDSKYITSRHDGKVYAFDQSRTEKRAPLFSQKFSTPVARVFDICRPWDAVSESNPQLVVLPQPPMPSDDEGIARMRSSSIFLNQTESGSWYAMSGRAYPLIVDAPAAKIAHPDWWEMAPTWETVDQARISKALVGTHHLETLRGGNKQRPSLPAGSISDGEVDQDNDSELPLLPEPILDEPTIVTKVKSLPQSAANSVVDFVSNPILILLFFGALVYNEKKLRRAYHRLRAKGVVKEAYDYFLPEVPNDEKGAESTTEVKQKLPAASILDAKPEAEITKSDTADELPSTEDGDDEKPVKIDTVQPDRQVSPPKLSPKISDQSENGPSSDGPTTPGPDKKKKAHRGRRGGVKHRKGRARENSQSRDDEPPPTTVEEAVNNAKKLGDRPKLEPDVMTIGNDMQAVTGPVIRMGNIEVDTEQQLGTGSNGTLVFAGRFDGREVAVKRMLIQFYDIASQETRLLRESDDHPNVIRYYSQQQQDGFLYIALERCAASLADVVEKPHAYRDLANAGRMDLPAVLYQITNGISHLHNLRIVHRDLKPQNILINMGKEGKPRLLVSDFGLCKKLEGGQSSFGATTGRAAGTSGWRAPELLLDDDSRELSMVDASTHSGSGSVLVGDNGMPNGRRATRAIDIFSLGLVFFYVLTNGSHPFDCGDRYMREVNIRKGSYNLRLLDALGDFAYEAKDLIASMLDADPRRRPQARDVMSHPFFWSAKKRLAFLCDVSDHFEKEPRDPPSPALAELERHAMEVTKGDFLRLLPRDFVDSLGKQRKYTGSRLLDLLRALRNKRNHYEDMSENLRRTVGPLPEGYLSFWTLKFPMLLLVCWNVVYNVQWEETDRFREYYEPAML